MRTILIMLATVALAVQALAGSSLKGSTFFGGTGSDDITAVAIAPDGSIYVAGIAGGSVPTTGGAFDETYNGGTDAFVARFSANFSNLLAATLLGGTGDDGARALYLASNGQVCVAGYTFSSGFPVSGSGYDRSYAGAGDAFVSILSADLTALVASTFLGGTGLDDAFAVRKGDGSGIFVGGRTGSTNFPMAGFPFDATPNGSDDAFVAQLSETLAALDASTYLGGSASDGAQALAISPSDNSVVIAGTSQSDNYHVTPTAFDASRNGATDLVVSRLSPDLSLVLASTYVGPGDALASIGLAVDGAGRPYTACRATSQAFPTRSGSYDTNLNGAADIAVSLLSPGLTNVIASTFLGGGGVDTALGLALDSAGNVGVAGQSLSPDFPVTPGPLDGVYAGNVANADAVIATFSASLSSLLRATYYRGNGGDDTARHLAFDGAGGVVVAGGTLASDLVMAPGAYDPSLNGLSDGFIARLSLEPENTTGADGESDGRSDLLVYDRGTATWYFNQSTAGFRAQQFGYGDVDPVAGDYDGDGRYDVAVYDPDSGTWYILQPSGGVRVQQFGYAGVVPVPADYDGDGRTDFAVYDTLSFTWYFLRTSAGFAQQQFGYGPVLPVPADYDGDGKADVGVFDRSTGFWYLLRSRDGFFSQQFGFGGVVPAPCDYDGDGRVDLGVYDRTRATWYLMQSRDGFKSRVYGVGTVAPVPADYDGDNRADTSVYDLSSGVWHIFQSRIATNPDRSQQFGYQGAHPVLPQYMVNRAFGFP